MIIEGKRSAVRDSITSNNSPNKGMGHNLEETDQACHEITTLMADPRHKSASAFGPLDRYRVEWTAEHTNRNILYCPGNETKTNMYFFLSSLRLNLFAENANEVRTEACLHNRSAT
jgi:hypothetical protein